MKRSRRYFIMKASTAGAALLAAPAVLGSPAAQKQKKATDAVTPFKLKYAPSLGMFRQNAGEDPIDNIKFCHDMGFRAVFDNNFMRRAPELQEKIMNELRRLGMDFGPYVLMADSGKQDFVLNSPEIREALIAKMKEAVELAKRTGAKMALVVPGRYDMKLHMDYQTANVIDNLRYCCDVVEPEGITLVLEPLNPYINHPGLFLQRIPQAYAICRAVNRPSCKIVNDIYHQQITEGNLIPNIDMAWSEIAAFHLGDSPGRNEPTTGEINYKNIFKHLYEKQYNGVLCMEHGISQRGTKEGELRVIQAYRECDNFEV
ncbi:MAG TPA: TIM barrel protein [Bacteroidales bacterium]|nr:TIM barrel protein [Bacteroidales bacterium]HOK75210.1 TIM barrel protein [Bacteroidales bacterium]HPP93504.1 TIM barrel protein [Bacteroidales bacterium]HRR17302.1 TIM barrel protein [Bacteroidales bacterium]